MEASDKLNRIKMKGRAIPISTAVLTVLAFFLVYIILWQSGGPPEPGPSVIADTALLITVVLAVAFCFWMVFAGKSSQKSWRKGMLVIGLICGSFTFWLLGVLVSLSSVPIGIESRSLAGKFMLTIAGILGLAVILALFLIAWPPSNHTSSRDFAKKQSSFN